MYIRSLSQKKGIEQVMARGIVKWFNSQKGFGFICPSEGGEDVFAHFSAIIMDGYKTLKAGQDVTFNLQHGPKGLHAADIRIKEDSQVAGF